MSLEHKDWRMLDGDRKICGHVRRRDTIYEANTPKKQLLEQSKMKDKKRYADDFS